MVRRRRRQKVSKEIANKYAAQSYCSIANSAMPKANTRRILLMLALAPGLRRFSDLRIEARLAWRMRLLMPGITQRKTAGIPKLKLKGSGAYMFDGKNNRLLDSFSFRLALTAAVFAVWSGAGYVLLYLA